MHPISYQLKRGHLCAVAIGRRIFRGTKKPDDPDFDGVLDMTPARFDMLYLLFHKRLGVYQPPHGLPMAELVRRLGLARATVSKAVQRLVELGLVTLSYMNGSARNKWVELTREGVARIKRALYIVFTGRALARHYRTHAGQRCTRGRRQRRARILNELVNMHDEAQALAVHLFDRSVPIYPVRGDWDH